MYYFSPTWKLSLIQKKICGYVFIEIDIEKIYEYVLKDIDKKYTVNYLYMDKWIIRLKEYNQQKCSVNLPNVTRIE